MKGQSELRFDTRPREIVTVPPLTSSVIARIEAEGGIVYAMERIPRLGNATWKLRIRWPDHHNPAPAE